MLTVSSYSIIFVPKTTKIRQLLLKLSLAVGWYPSSICPHNTVNFGPLTAKMVWRVWAPRQSSTGFASWLRYCTDVAQRRPASQCLHDVWPSPGLVKYIHFGALAPDGILPGAKFTLCASFALSCIGSVTARHASSGRQQNFAAWYKES